MPDITVDIELEGNLPPQLIVISAAIQDGNEVYIENHCCMVRTSEELNSETSRWIDELLEKYEKDILVIRSVVRHVPYSVYKDLIYKLAHKLTTNPMAQTAPVPIKHHG